MQYCSVTHERIEIDHPVLAHQPSLARGPAGDRDSMIFLIVEVLIGVTIFISIFGKIMKKKHPLSVVISLSLSLYL
jgi:hypothetical protein